MNYSITVINKGDEVATDIVITEILPAESHLVSINALDEGSCQANTLTCTLPDLNPGDKTTVKVVVSNTQTKKLENTIIVSTNEYFYFVRL